MVKYLVPRFGQHRFDEDNDGKTCLDWAVEGQKHNVLEYLQQKGGFSDWQWLQQVSITHSAVPKCSLHASPHYAPGVTYL